MSNTRAMDERYVKKTDTEYKKTDIPSKIPFKRKENPKEWTKQYGWFRNNPEATVYAPKKRGGRRAENSHPRRTDHTKNITVLRRENPKEYFRQYNFFKKNPEATVYVPPDTKSD